MNLTWTANSSNYVITWTTPPTSEQPPESAAGVPSKPLSPAPTLPDAAAEAESDACAP